MARYGKKVQEYVEQTMHEFKQGTLESAGGNKVTSPRQALAIGLSKARKAGSKMPPAPATKKQRN